MRTQTQDSQTQKGEVKEAAFIALKQKTKQNLKVTKSKS